MINPELFEGLQNNDACCQQRFITYITPRLIFFFRKNINGNFPLEDLLQNTFLAFFNGISEKKLHSYTELIPFLYGIARNNVYNYFYESKKNSNLQQKLPFNEKLICENIQFREMIEQDQLKLITEKISKLKEIDRKIIRLFFLEEKNIEQISRILNKNKHYISVRKERALKKLRSEIVQKKPYK